MGEVSLRVVAFVRLDGRLAQFASALAGCVTVTLVSVGTSDDEWWPRMMHSSVTPPRETMVPRHLSLSLSLSRVSRWLESTNTWICCSLCILYHISYFLFLDGHLDALQTAITITASMLYNKHLQCSTVLQQSESLSYAYCGIAYPIYRHRFIISSTRTIHAHLDNLTVTYYTTWYGTTRSYLYRK